MKKRQNKKDSHHVKLQINDGVSVTHMSMNYDIQTDAVGLNERPGLYPFSTVVFGKPVVIQKLQMLRNLAHA